MSEFKVNTYTVNDQIKPRIIALINGEFIITWSSNGQDGSGYGIYAQKYDANGNTEGSEFRVNNYTLKSQSTSSGISFSDNSFVITYTAEDRDVSNRWVAYAQAFTPNSTAIGSEVKVADGINSYVSISKLDEQSFVLTQPLACTPTLCGLFSVQRYEKNINPLGTQISINDQPNYPGYIRISTLKDGNFVVIWPSNRAYNTITEPGYIYGQMFNSVGSTIGSKFQVSSFPSGRKDLLSVAALQDGGFVAVWTQQNAQDGSKGGIFAQRYDKNGIKIMGEFQVNTYTNDEQTTPFVSSLNNGEFIITWQSNGQDGSGYGIYAQRYDANGNTAGSEFRVNTYTTGDQIFSSVESLSNGGFIITWQSNGQDSDGWGIYAQRYDSSGNTVDQGTPILPPNTAPTSGALALSVASGGQAGVNFASVVSDQEDSINALKIKIKTLPIAGKLYDKKGSEVAIDSIYTVSELVYKETSTTATSDSFTYTVVDTNNAESNQYTVGIAINDPAPSPIQTSTSTTQESSRTTEIIITSSVVSANTTPSCSNTTFSVTPSGTVTVNLTNKVSDNEDTDDKLQVKIKSTPKAGKLYNKSNQEAVVGNGYAVNELQYRAGNAPVIDSFSYTILDTQLLESNQCTVGIAINDPAPSPIQTATSTTQESGFNTTPSCTNFFLLSNTGSSAIIDFQSKINDKENSSSNLKIKLYNLPKCGSVLDISSKAAILSKLYDIGELLYTACNTAINDNLAYSAVDIQNLESNQCTVGIMVSAPASNAEITINDNDVTGKLWFQLTLGLGIPVIATVVGGIILKKLELCCFAPNKSSPVGIALTEGREIELILYLSSKVSFDYSNSGTPQKTSWIGSKDAILAYDYDDSNMVDYASKIVLTSWCKEAKTDFEAMLCAFDSNKDQRFDKQDTEFSKFYLWQDKNQNGVSEAGELTSLQEAGFGYIDFSIQEPVHGIMREEYGVLNTAELHWEDGRVTKAYDLNFSHE